MRLAATALSVAILFTAGCGYVGPVLPPSPEIPNAVTDLKILERGDQLVINFSTPVRTTDSLAIWHFSEVDLWIGPDATPFNLETWSASAKQYQLSLPAVGDEGDVPKPVPVSKSIPAAEWAGKQVVVLVRTAVKKTDHYSQWSNRAVLDVVPPLERPALTVKATRRGYMLTWKSAAGVQYRILRQDSGQNAPIEIATADASPYVDESSQWDTPCTYTVVAQQKAAESLPSEPVLITHANTFPPAAPESLTGLAGPESIELSWSRNVEADLKGYYVYRSADGAPFERIGDLTNLPTYSDTKVVHGKTYRYAITAVNHNGNESDKSPPREVVF